MYNLKQQIKSEMDETRKELIKLCKGIKPEEFVWEPRPGMKSVKAQLEEIGIMEVMHTRFLATGNMPDWKKDIVWNGDDADSFFKDLAGFRKETEDFMQSCSDEDFLSMRPIPEPWQQWWGKEAGVEAMIRWIERHEYYHVGQITYNRWMLGYNPYDEA